MTHPEIPKAMIAAAVKAYETCRAAGESSSKAMHKALSTAALPHLHADAVLALLPTEEDIKGEGS